MSNLQKSDAKTWVFETGKYGLDAPQQAKSLVANSNDDVEYHDLCARVMNNQGLGDTYVVVLEK